MLRDEAQGFIRTLVKLIQDGSRTNQKSRGSVAYMTDCMTKITNMDGIGRGKKDAQPLLRPVICICNDL